MNLETKLNLMSINVKIELITDLKEFNEISNSIKDVNTLFNYSVDATNYFQSEYNIDGADFKTLYQKIQIHSTRNKSSITQ